MSNLWPCDLVCKGFGLQEMRSEKGIKTLFITVDKNNTETCNHVIS